MLTRGFPGSLALSACAQKGSVSCLCATKRWWEVKPPDLSKLLEFLTVRYLRSE